jgi:broad specificity phosphatase PhoE
MFLVLHGQTEWNRDGKLQGRQDSPLTEFGRQQGMTAGRTLQELGCTAQNPIVSSPLGRTMATANIFCSALSKDPGQIETDPRLAELSFGVWEGLTWPDVLVRWPEETGGVTRNAALFRAPGGESYDSLVKRVEPWLDAHAKQTGLIVVTHGVASRALRGLYLGLPRDMLVELEVARDAVYRLDRGAVTKF